VIHLRLIGPFYTSAQEQHISIREHTMPAAVRQADLGSDFDNLKLESEDESFEVQVPDFHFDWGVITDDKAATMIVEEKHGFQSRISALSGRQAHASERWGARPTPSDNMNTPPPGRAGSPAYSSASSAHIMGLTDASTASGSSLVPTPPYASLGRGYMPRISGASEGDDSAQPERIRRFQRVVSAPVTRSPAPLGSDRTGREMDESVSLACTREADRSDRLDLHVHI
jgi:serine/threonine-protein kinase TTK/MPS1